MTLAIERPQRQVDGLLKADINRTYAGTLYIAYCRHKNLHTIISFFQIDITFNVSLNKVTIRLN